jgi:hypothetical protein
LKGEQPDEREESADDETEVPATNHPIALLS